MGKQQHNDTEKGAVHPILISHFFFNYSTVVEEPCIVQNAKAHYAVAFIS